MSDLWLKRFCFSRNLFIIKFNANFPSDAFKGSQLSSISFNLRVFEFPGVLQGILAGDVSPDSPNPDTIFRTGL